MDINGLLTFVLMSCQFLGKFLLALLATGVFGLFLVFVAFLPVFALAFMALHPAGFLLLATNFGFVSLFLLICVVFGLTFRKFIKSEMEIINRFGAEHCLWVDSNSSWVNLSHTIPTWLATTTPVTEVSRPVSALFGLKGPKTVNYYQLSSILWADFIVMCDKYVGLSPGGSLAVAVFIIAFSGRLLYLQARVAVRGFQVYLVLLTSIFLVNPGSLLFVMGTVFSLVKYAVKTLSSEQVWQWLCWQATSIIVDFTNFMVEYEFVSRKYTNRSGFNPVNRHFKPMQSLNTALSKLAIVVADMGLPSYIYNKGNFDREHIANSMDVMKELGWPINVELDDPSRFGSSSKYVDWLVSGTTWEQGLHQRKMYVDHALDPLRVRATEWRRTEEYRTLDNELASISRYFKSPRFDFPDIELDDVWFLLGDIFRMSRLTPMNYIIKMWEKKYALGSFMVDPDRPWKKYSRKKFISSIGYKAFKDLWRRTFEVASSLAPVAHVSVKDEALPPKKYLQDKLRTVVGSPLGQYILSTVFNYGPNHNFRWRETPIKVGMPLNGYWMDFTYTKHSRCQEHFAGDMSDFDSTLSGKLLDLIAAVRKRGYASHKDRDRIAKLIDINYELVSKQLLNTTSTGDIYAKGTGLTTGHSATSTDNSMATVILYFMAWKQLTGMNAREFVRYNELSCFGDDHILSMSATKPSTWTFGNIQHVMSRWGITMRLEASGDLKNIPFLSKRVRKLTPQDWSDLEKAGVKYRPNFAVFHEKDRLVGKMVSSVKTLSPEYRLKRLLSYLSLTAHHKDVYKQLSNIINRTNSFKGIMRNKGLHVPSYSKVLSDWYSDKATFPHKEMEEIDPSLVDVDANFSYGGVTEFELLLSGLAQIPDLINPSVFNFGYLATFQSHMSKIVSWPIHLIALKNDTKSPGELANLVSRGCYSMLDPTLVSHLDEQPNWSSIVLRHWLYVSYIWLFHSKRTEGIFRSIANKFGSIAFMINGHVHLESRRVSLQILDMFVIALLGNITIPAIFEWTFAISVPEVMPFIDRIWWFVYTNFWASLPPNYNDTNKHIRSLKSGEPLLIEAPTGSGKTTSFIRHLLLTTGHRFDKIIVIEPRSSIVSTVTPYVRTALSLDATGCTSGMTMDPDAKVVYCTGQELLLHQSWLSKNYLFVVDECHINEPAYEVTKTLLLASKVHLILMSATPNKADIDSCTHIPLISARLYSIHESRESMNSVRSEQQFNEAYMQMVGSIIQSKPKMSKALVFCTTTGMAYQALSRYSGRGCVLSSTNKVDNIDEFDTIFTTSVADVGLTLPDIDLVITSDIGFTVESLLSSSRKIYYKLPPPAIKQRVGRTGRTNNGRAIVVTFPNASFVESDFSGLSGEGKIMELLSTGVPASFLATIYRQDLLKLFRLDKANPDYADATFPYIIDQMDKYHSNLEPLLRERMNMLDLETNDGSPPAIIDNARMGLVRQSSSVPTDVLLREIYNVAVALGKRHTAKASTARRLEEKIRQHSQVLLGNIKAKLPFPDPDLGEWGMDLN
ncbi:RNA dependent RNA polymerase [Corynespora cassiicola fusarivirus 1]|nr:RNA dependent RNA polymerase [Corynespora cassiicola fusarivirus 1]